MCSASSTQLAPYLTLGNCTSPDPETARGSVHLTVRESVRVSALIRTPKRTPLVAHPCIKRDRSMLGRCSLKTYWSPEKVRI